jgi:carbon-monoxide dehydrogenase medium subunit
MKAAPFAYAAARSLGDVFDLLDEHGDDARLLAGGQSLMPALALRLAQPSVLIDINGLKTLRFIEEREGAVHIGALARHCDLEASRLIAQKLPLIAQAIPHVAHRAIRNRGTIGGSAALADPAAELPACLIALGATIVVASRSGERRVPAADFFRGLYQTDLRTGEMLVRFEILPRPDCRDHFAEFSRRRGDYAIVGLAARVQADWREVSLVFLNCAGRPMRSPRAEEITLHRRGSPGYAKLREALEAELDPPSDLQAAAATRTHLAAVLADRALALLKGN